MMTRSMSDTKRGRTARKATSPIMAVMPMILSRTCILLGVPAETLLGLFGQEVNQPLRRSEQSTVVAAPPAELHAHRQAAFRLQQRQRHRRRDRKSVVLGTRLSVRLDPTGRSVNQQKVLTKDNLPKQKQLQT